MTELEVKWIEAKAMMQDRFGKVPDMEGIVYLIGVNEVGFNTDRPFEKEEKQDLMHVAMCTLLSYDGYYEFVEVDADGWPHFKKIQEFPAVNLAQQEAYLKEKIIQYLGL